VKQSVAAIATNLILRRCEWHLVEKPMFEPLISLIELIAKTSCQCLSPSKGETKIFGKISGEL
jgi:hypothetical protein